MKKLMLILVALASLSWTAAPLLAAEQINNTTTANETKTITSLTNINTATAAELEKLPGIGKKSANAIVAFRTEKGNFKTPKDLLKVKGVGKKTVEKIQNLISFK